SRARGGQEGARLPKKSGGVLRAAKQVKFDFIAAESASKTFDVEFMCRMLGVSSSGYYARKKRRICQRKREGLALVPLLHAEVKKYAGGCGSRTLVGALRQQGRCVSRKRVVRLMAEEKLRCRLRRRFAVTTRSTHREPIAPNVLKRAFRPGKPNRAWAADI